MNTTTLNTQSMTAAQLDGIALERSGVVGSIAGGTECRGEVGQLAGGWGARWINTQGLINHGTLVLSATDRRTRELSKEGKIREFMRAGLSRIQAEQLYRADVPYKFELIGLLGRVLADPVKIEAMQAHPRTSVGYGRVDWLRSWSAVFGPGGLGLTAHREVALAKMVEVVV